jgi:hypothetical protein
VDLRSNTLDRGGRQGHQLEGHAKQQPARHAHPAQGGWSGWAAPNREMKWVLSPDGKPEWSSCEYTMPMMDWTGCTQLIMARGGNYTVYTEARGHGSVSRDDQEISEGVSD